MVGSNSLSTEVSGIIGDSSRAAAAPGTALAVKAGTGTLTLSGVNTYTGATTVNAGTLIVNGSIASSSLLTVNAGAAVGGTGTLPTTTSSTARCRPATRSARSRSPAISPSSAPATTSSRCRADSADRTNVTGTATLTGTVQALLPARLVSRPAHIVLSADGGRTGTFDTVTSTNPLVNVLVTYYADRCAARALRPTSRRSPRRLNQTNVATALAERHFNRRCAGPFVGAVQPHPAGLPAALDPALGRDRRPAPRSAGFTRHGPVPQPDARPVPGEPRRRLGRQCRRAGARLRAGRRADAALAYRLQGTAAQGAAALLPPFEQRWTVWGAGYGGHGKFDGDAAVIGSHDLLRQHRRRRRAASTIASATR